MHIPNPKTTEKQVGVVFKRMGVETVVAYFIEQLWRE